MHLLNKQSAPRQRRCMSKLVASTLLTLAAGSALAQTNGTMLQYFDWDSNGDGQHWNRVKAGAPGWATKGITAFWLPPAVKGWRRRLGCRLRHIRPVGPR